MIRAVGRGAPADGDEEDGGEGNNTSTEKYSGVKVKVRFTGAGEAVSVGAPGPKSLKSFSRFRRVSRRLPHQGHATLVFRRTVIPE